MTLRQFAIVTLLFGAGLAAASVARPESWEPAIGSSPKPVKSTVALLAEPPVAEPAHAIRVILPSPYEAK